LDGLIYRRKLGCPDVPRFVGTRHEGEHGRRICHYLRLLRVKLPANYAWFSVVSLINGQRLAQPMILHSVGVRTRQTYLILSLDEDYFATVFYIYQNVLAGSPEHKHAGSENLVATKLEIRRS